jgi:hypothetical protein
MPFGISAAEIRAFPDQFPGVQSTRAISPPSGRGLYGRIVQAAYRSALIPDRRRFTVTELRFGTTEHP